jgi:glycosyltransferase involved in cell wall biosynthesis
MYQWSRLIERKGVSIAVKTVDAIGAKLIIAGQGDYPIRSPNCEVIGYVGPEERADLMGHAKAVFVPTLYLEAFGGVNVFWGIS